MIDCMIIGDSIAVGVHMARTECVRYAKNGINSSQWNKEFLHSSITRSYSTIIISLGANDYNGVQTEIELRKMRMNIQGKRVFWISPGKERKPVAYAAMQNVAKDYGDVILERPKEHMSGDGVHPTGKGYKILADQTR